jgi:hypothetical protein
MLFGHGTPLKRSSIIPPISDPDSPLGEGVRIEVRQFGILSYQGTAC